VNDRPPKPRGEPTPNRRLLENGVLGMLVFVFTEVMFFAGFISAITIVKAEAVGGWPPPGQPRLPVAETAVNTVALLVSGVLLVMAGRAFRRDQMQSKRWMLASIVLGTFFVGLQGREWILLLAEGLTLTSSTLGAFFYVIVGIHALHAIVALCGLIWAWVKLRSGELNPAVFATIQVFWYFIVLLWPVLYVQVYL